MSWTTRHWTREGTISIEAKLLKGEVVYVVCKNGMETTAVFMSPFTAAARIAEGDCDNDLQIVAKGLSIPKHFKDWNGLN